MKKAAEASYRLQSEIETLKTKMAYAEQQLQQPGDADFALQRLLEVERSARQSAQLCFAISLVALFFGLALVVAAVYFFWHLPRWRRLFFGLTSSIPQQVLVDRIGTRWRRVPTRSRLPDFDAAYYSEPEL